MKGFISYYAFHTGRKCPPRDAYAKTETALRHYSDRDVPSGCGFSLEMRTDERSPLDTLCSEVCRRYGPINEIIPGASFSGPGFKTYRWKVAPAQFPGALELLERAQQELPSYLERIHISAWWEFKLVNPENREPLAGQESLPAIDVRLPAGSSLSLIATDKPRIHACFLFPFEDVNEEFRAYVAGLQEHMIFKFVAKHWRAWRLSHKGKWHLKRLNFELSHGDEGCDK